VSKVWCASAFPTCRRRWGVVWSPREDGTNAHIVIFCLAIPWFLNADSLSILFMNSIGGPFVVMDVKLLFMA
jgi:hypothetical protein